LAGLYIHIPFCHKVCHYCDFAVLKAPNRVFESYLYSLQNEWMTKKSLIQNPSTLYFGGGTPSILNTKQWSFLFGLFGNQYQEISVEANPDSLDSDKLKLWKENEVSRVSIGVQSFQDDLLQTMGRSHSAIQAKSSIENALAFGFSVSVDFIFGLPNQSIKIFLADLKSALELGVQHISFYGLTVEDNTLFSQWEKKKSFNFDMNDYDVMYQEGVRLVESYGLKRYEVSNFAKPGFESIHNSSYWNQIEYLGLGPGAHSYLNGKRYWNQRHLKKWQDKSKFADFEELTPTQKEWERLWLGLRQRDGVVGFPSHILAKYPESLHCKENKTHLIGRGWLDLDLIMSEILP
jgi:oxygen-independent coproporphyrinogen-3 oxidase